MSESVTRKDAVMTLNMFGSLTIKVLRPHKLLYHKLLQPPQLPRPLHHPKIAGPSVRKGEYATKINAREPVRTLFRGVHNGSFYDENLTEVVVEVVEEFAIIVTPPKKLQLRRVTKRPVGMRDTKGKYATKINAREPVRTLFGEVTNGSFYDEHLTEVVVEVVEELAIIVYPIKGWSWQ